MTHDERQDLIRWLRAAARDVPLRASVRVERHVLVGQADELDQLSTAEAVLRGIAASDPLGFNGVEDVACRYCRGDSRSAQDDEEPYGMRYEYEHEAGCAWVQARALVAP